MELMIKDADDVKRVTDALLRNGYVLSIDPVENGTGYVIRILDKRADLPLQPQQLKSTLEE